MRTIHKYPLPLVDSFALPMPYGSEILSVQYQVAIGACIWAAVDTDQKPENRLFHIVGTGHELEDWMTAEHHIGTWQQGDFVGHLFEWTPPEAPDMDLSCI